MRSSIAIYAVYAFWVVGMLPDGGLVITREVAVLRSRSLSSATMRMFRFEPLTFNGEVSGDLFEKSVGHFMIALLSHST
jgi:hypothetical protein